MVIQNQPNNSEGLGILPLWFGLTLLGGGALAAAASYMDDAPWWLDPIGSAFPGKIRLTNPPAPAAPQVVQTPVGAQLERWTPDTMYQRSNESFSQWQAEQASNTSFGDKFLPSSDPTINWMTIGAVAVGSIALMRIMGNKRRR